MIKITFKIKEDNRKQLISKVHRVTINKLRRDYKKKRGKQINKQISHSNQFISQHLIIIAANNPQIFLMQQSMSQDHPIRQQKLYVNLDDEQQQQSGTFEMIRKMIQQVKQQQLSPDLLEFQQQLFQKLKQQLKQQQKNVAIYKQRDEDDDTPNAEKNYKSMIYSMEIEKINYILKHYLRIRLEKIQKCAFYYFKSMDQSNKLMSQPQLEFLKSYVDLRYKYYEKNVFKHLVKNFKGVGGMEVFLGKQEQRQLVKTNQSTSDMIQPDVHSYVFVKMNRNPHEFRYQTDIPVNGISRQESKIASSNDILFIPYLAAKALMERSEDGDLVLI